MRLSKTAKPIGAVRETAMGSRSPAGPRRLETATRISASLSRRLSAFFGSATDQGPKAAKFAVLTPGHAGFPNRAKRFQIWDGEKPREQNNSRQTAAARQGRVDAVHRRRGPAGLRDPVAVPLTALIGFTILLSRIVAHRKLSACSLVTAVWFLNRCSRRSMRETYPSEQRSGCRF